jgi:hypothetical protein
LYVIVPEIILNYRGLGSDLWWRMDPPPSWLVASLVCVSVPLLYRPLHYVSE